MANSCPPDLRVLCRKLTSVPPAELPRAIPSLTNHVVRCKAQLAASYDLKAKDKSSEAAGLIYKLKTGITTLLTSRTIEGRFTAVALVRAVIDVGGWEVLRGCEPWARGLLAVIQKNDPFASKELATATLTRLYTLVHPYQTLVREIATPTIPAFATALVALLKSKTTPAHLVETICESLRALIPLFPTTLRPFSSQIRTSTKTLVAPTSSDATPVALSLQTAAGRLVASLHHVAAKAGGSEEWGKMVDGCLRDLHATADQIFRAVEESWDGGNGYTRGGNVSLDGLPSGGGSAPEDLPAWEGMVAGSERLAGLCHLLSHCLTTSTKSAVAIPTGALVDAVTRICSIARLSPKTQTWDQALQIRGGIDREEKDQLWALMPELHIAALRILLQLFALPEQDVLPLLPEALDNLTRVFASGIETPVLRATSYEVLSTALRAAGPTLSKASVGMLEPLINACCRDLQEDVGALRFGDKLKPVGNDGKKPTTTAVNADLFLQNASSVSKDSDAPSSILSSAHRAAAAALLVHLLSSLPQQHLDPRFRAILDQTAILTRNRDAMIASVLNPYKDTHGRAYASILPHLTAQFPHDLALDILRTNLRTDVVRAAEDLMDAIDEDADEEGEEEEEEEEEDQAMAEAQGAAEKEAEAVAAAAPAPIPAAPKVQLDLPLQSNPFEPSEVEATAVFGARPAEEVAAAPSSPPKRKNASPESVPAKRQEVGERHEAKTVAVPKPAEMEDEDESDDESVHLNMEMSDEED